MTSWMTEYTMQKTMMLFWHEIVVEFGPEYQQETTADDFQNVY